jgi:hypothetical protein
MNSTKSVLGSWANLRPLLVTGVIGFGIGVAGTFGSAGCEGDHFGSFRR